MKKTLKVKLAITLALALVFVQCSQNSNLLTNTTNELITTPIMSNEVRPQTIEGIAWEIDVNGQFSAPLTHSPELVLFVTGTNASDTELHAVNPLDGYRKWSRKIDGVIDSAPAYGYERIFVGTRQGELICLRADDGQSLWSRKLDDPVLGTPTVRNSGVYVSAGSVYRLTFEGEIVWNKRFGVRSVQPVREHDNVLTVLASDNMLYLLDAEKGSVRNAYKVWFNVSGGVVIDYPAVYITGDNSYVQAIDIYSEDYLFGRAIRWWWTKAWLYGLAPPPRYPPGYLWQARDLGGNDAYPVRVDDSKHLVIVKSSQGGGSANRFDPISGEVLWRIADHEYSFTESAVLLGKYVVLANEGGQIRTVDYLTGEIVAEYFLGDIAEGPIYLKNNLIFGSKDGTIISLAVR